MSETANPVPAPQPAQTLPQKPELPKRFVEKGPMVVYDTQTQIYWLKKDSWQDKSKFLNWHEARDYADAKNMRKIGGFDDWRLPTADEAETLFDQTAENPGKGGVVLRLDKVFPEGAFPSVWLTGDTSTRRPRFSLADGKLAHADEYSFGSVRACRKDKAGAKKKNQALR
jgi:hypothetical protein